MAGLERTGNLQALQEKPGELRKKKTRAGTGEGILLGRPAREAKKNKMLVCWGANVLCHQRKETRCCDRLEGKKVAESAGSG